MFDYATHAPILLHVILEHNIKTAIETGMGFYSTAILDSFLTKFYSVEMDSHEWYENICGLFCRSLHFSPIFMSKKQTLSSVFDDLPSVDLGFVDGHGLRNGQVENLFKKTNLILAHDTQEPSHDYHLVKRPSEDWQWHDVISYPTWTGIITTRPEVINSVDRVFRTMKRDW